MITWEKLDKKSLELLRKHYLNYAPYAHLNIVDLWGYKTGLAHWFKVGDTVVYRLNDYMDGKKYFTILGQKSAIEAIIILCNKNKQHKVLTLDGVPKITLQALGNWDAITSCKEDKDAHDYIFSTKSFINFSSTRLRHKYPTYHKLIHRYPGLKVRVLNHKKSIDRRLIYTVFKRWVIQADAVGWQRELAALKRSLNLGASKLICLGVFDDKKMIGYTVNEPEKNGYYQAHFGKADRNYRGLGLLLEHETAKYLYGRFGSKYLNLQQDLGIEGLRYYKSSLGPTKKLKKYTLEINTKKARA